MFDGYLPPTPLARYSSDLSSRPTFFKSSESLAKTSSASSKSFFSDPGLRDSVSPLSSDSRFHCFLSSARCDVTSPFNSSCTVSTRLPRHVPCTHLPSQLARQLGGSNVRLALPKVIPRAILESEPIVPSMPGFADTLLVDQNAGTVVRHKVDERGEWVDLERCADNDEEIALREVL